MHEYIEKYAILEDFHFMKEVLFMCKTVHFPDSSFIKHCNKHYGIDQEMYNSIDRLFYK